MSISRQSTTTTSDRQALWLCIYFPQLPIEVFNREQQDKPVVILSRQRVSFLNQAARDIGIQPGSSMNTAYTISEQVVSFERDEVKEHSMLTHLAQWSYQFSPAVVVRSPHSLLLEISGSLSLFKGLANLKSRVLDGLHQLGFDAVIGVNVTPLSALVFARACLPDNTGACRASLTNVPVHCLDIETSTITSLHQIGISTCRQLFDLPQDGLNRRYGVFFTDYLLRLTGERPDPQKYISDKPQFRSEITFLSDVTNLTSLAFPVKRLLGELQTFLRGRQLLVNQFTFRLSHRSHAHKEFTVLLANPDSDARMFLMLSQLQLEKIDDIKEIDAITLYARNFYALDAPASDLFQGTPFQHKDGRTHSKAEEARVTRLINMMTARLGPQACFGLALANDHRPELAWRPVALNTRTETVESPDQNIRPLYLLPDPKQLNTFDGRPTIAGQLTLLQGPERIDYGWWDSKEINRDYYIAKHDTGALYWIYQHLVNQQWYLHGIFS